MNYDVVFSARISATSGTISVGQGLCLSSDGTSYVPANTANIAAASNVFGGIAVTAAFNNGYVNVQTTGTVASTLLSLGTGVAGPVGLDVNGIPVRIVVVTGLELVIGKCDTAGNLKLSDAGGLSPIPINPGGGNTAIASGAIGLGKALVLVSSGTMAQFTLAKALAGSSIVGISTQSAVNGAQFTYAPIGSVVSHTVTGLAPTSAGVAGVDATGSLYAIAQGRNGFEAGTMSATGDVTIVPHTPVTNSSRSTINLEMFGGRPMANLTDTSGALANIVAWNTANVYGAKGQGAHLEIADRYYLGQYQSMMLQPHHVTGLGAGYAGNGRGELYFDPKYGGVVCTYTTLAPGAYNCSGASFRNLDIMTVAGTYANVSEWQPNTLYVANAYVRKRAVATAPGQKNCYPHYYYRTINGGTSGATEPAAFSAPTMAYPYQWSPGITVHVGDVLIAGPTSTAYGNGNAAKVTAISGGTSAVSRSDGVEIFTSGNMVQGQTVVDGAITWTIYGMTDVANLGSAHKDPPNVAGNPYVHDGSVDWVLEQPNGLFVNNVGILTEHCQFFGFQGFGRCDYGLGIGNFNPLTNAVFGIVKDSISFNCGGMYCAANSDNINGIIVTGCKAENSGQQFSGVGYGAGVGFLAQGQGNPLFERCYAEGFAIGFWADGSAAPIFDHCISESSELNYVGNGYSRGGNLISRGVVATAGGVIEAPRAQHIWSWDTTAPVGLIAKVDLQDGLHMYTLGSTDEIVSGSIANGGVPGFIGMNYGNAAPGWYGKTFNISGEDDNVFAISGTKAQDGNGNVEGRAHFWKINGEFQGVGSNRIYTGYEPTEYSGTALASRLAGMRRIIGSAFRTNAAPTPGAYRNTYVAVTGYKASAVRNINFSSYVTDSYAAGTWGTTIEPGDGQVWLLTRAGTTSGTATSTLFPATPTKTTPGSRAQVWFPSTGTQAAPGTIYVLDQPIRPNTTPNGHAYKVSTALPVGITQANVNGWSAGAKYVGFVCKGVGHVNANVVFEIESIDGISDYGTPATLTTEPNWSTNIAGDQITDTSTATHTIQWRALAFAPTSKNWAAYTIMNPGSVVRVEATKTCFQVSYQTFWDINGVGGAANVGLISQSHKNPNVNGCVFKCLTIGSSTNRDTVGQTGNETSAFASAKAGDVVNATNDGTLTGTVMSTWLAVVPHTLGTTPAWQTLGYPLDYAPQYLVSEGINGFRWAQFFLVGCTTEPGVGPAAGQPWLTGAGSDTASFDVPQIVFTETGALVSANSIQTDGQADWTLLGPVANATQEAVSDFIDDKYVKFTYQTCSVEGLGTNGGVIGNVNDPALNTGRIFLRRSKVTVASNAATNLIGNSNDANCILGTLPNNASRLVPQFPIWTFWKAVVRVALGRTDVAAHTNGMMMFESTQWGHTDAGGNAVLDGAATTTTPDTIVNIAGAAVTWAVPSGFLVVQVNPGDAVGGHTYAASATLTIEFFGSYS